MPGRSYVPRLVDELLEELFRELPAVLIAGPRAMGKTTTAERLAATVVHLDREREAEPFRADPDAALRSLPEPVLLDEWQAVPEVLGAVKRAIDQGGGGGRFLITGSAQARLNAPTWPGTGRLVHLRMWGLTVRELLGLTSTPGPVFFETLARDDIDAFGVPADVPDLRGYVELALGGGYPEPALNLGDRARSRWLASYLDELLTRDAAALDGPRDPLLLRRYFEAVAANSAGTATDKTLYDAAGISRATALAYERLLANLFVLDHVPAWSTNRLSRLVKSSKRYLTDTALLAAAVGADELAVMRDGDLLGRAIETFVLAQLRPELELSRFRPRVHHLREKNGRREIDLVVELAGGRVVAVDIKASAAPKRADARHLEWLRDLLGDRFLAGAVLHTGPRPFRLSERVFALPIATCWG